MPVCTLVEQAFDTFQPASSGRFSLRGSTSVSVTHHLLCCLWIGACQRTWVWKVQNTLWPSLVDIQSSRTALNIKDPQPRTLFFICVFVVTQSLTTVSMAKTDNYEFISRNNLLGRCLCYRAFTSSFTVHEDWTSKISNQDQEIWIFKSYLREPRALLSISVQPSLLGAICHFNQIVLGL